MWSLPVQLPTRILNLRRQGLFSQNPQPRRSCLSTQCRHNARIARHDTQQRRCRAGRLLAPLLPFLQGAQRDADQFGELRLRQASTRACGLRRCAGGNDFVFLHGAVGQYDAAVPGAVGATGKFRLACPPPRLDICKGFNQLRIQIAAGRWLDLGVNDLFILSPQFTQ